MGARARAKAVDGYGETLRGRGRAILDEAEAALRPQAGSAAAIHDFRKAMKRWRALMRLLEPTLGEAAREARIAARDLARKLADARDAQAALDGLADLAKAESAPAPAPALSPRSLASIRERIEQVRRAAEATALTPALRSELAAAIAALIESLAASPLHDLGFRHAARGLALGYARVRDAIVDDWHGADAETLHALRQRVVVHRYQMELVEPLWPRQGKLWVGEAQRLRERLGACQDLAVLERLTVPHAPLARWRSRLAPLIAARRSTNIATAQRLTGRLFAERSKAFRRRIQALWDHHGEARV